MSFIVCLFLQLSEASSASPKSECEISPSFTAVSVVFLFILKTPGVLFCVLMFQISNVILENKICDSVVCLPRRKGQRKAFRFLLQMRALLK